MNQTAQEEGQMVAPEFEKQWELLLRFLPKGWQDAAWSTRAIQRLRVVSSPAALLRLIFAYSWNDWSLRTTAAWAGRIGLANMSDVAVLKRLRHAPAWLGFLLDRWFQERGVGSNVDRRFRLVITDGTTIQEPGSHGTTWRLHARWDLASGRWTGVELTDVHGAESLTRLQLEPRDVVLADRNYATPQALARVVAQKADLVVRFGWNALHWQTPTGERWDPMAAARTLPDGVSGSWSAQIRVGKKQPPLPLRVVAIRKSAAATNRSQRKARAKANGKGYRVSDITLEAAQYVFILTTLPEADASAEDVLELYRLRWQIECAFKRLKTLIQIDHLRAFDPDLAQTYLLEKVLGALLVDALRTDGPDFSPYGFPVAPDIPRRVAFYRNDLE